MLIGDSTFMNGKESNRLLILGARTISADIADWASEIPGISVVGFVENEDRGRCNETFEGLPIYWVEALKDLAADHLAVCGLSTTHRSRFAKDAEQYGMNFATLVHPSASISPSCELGPGTLISRGVVIAALARLGRHVFVNRSASIGHHTKVGDFCTIQPGVTIAGACDIRASVYVGVGATIIEQVKVGAESFVTAGSLIRKTVPENVQIAGNPARIIRRGIDKR